MNKIRSMIVLLIVLSTMLACSLGGRLQPSETASPGDATHQATAEPATVTEAATNPPVEAASECDNPYMPVIAGATWEYKLTGPISDTFTHTILSVEAGAFTEQDVFETGVTRQGKWNCENGNLTALNPPSGSAGTVQAEGVQVDFETKEISGVTLPGQIHEGDMWSQTLTLEGTETINGQEFPARNELTSDCTALGMESVTVEAGTFEAMKVECNTAMNLTISIGGSDMKTPFNVKGTYWYVENIGLVKTLTTGMDLDSTTELVAYTIPQ